MTSFDLTGKTAIVTGGNGGIGRGIAIELARAGANVTIAARDAEKNAQTQREIDALGKKCIAVRCDVNSAQDIAAAIDATTDAFGAFQILVNNAGISGGLAAPQDLTDEQWDDVVQTNLTSVFKFCRAAYPMLEAEGGGKIINIGSMYSIFGSPFVANYSASKGGIVQLTKSLATSWAGVNIQVNAILPGWITTDMTAPIKQMDALYQQIIARTPAGRFGEPEECGGAAVFLASAAADFVTGQSIAVCGGFSIA
ncbi:MAG: glucose 1-dehydrogenase [Gammaproteobacteria bacterium]|nr:glucose 1-dehydrogenase [Gammaproteobacteria bacterium]